MGVGVLSGELRRAVFLDRDGVLVKVIVRDGRPYSPSRLAEMEILPGVREALERLRREGFLLIVVTNQPEVARGTLTADALEQMHRDLRQALPLDDIRVCLHDDADECACRKPKPGMILAAARRHGVDLRRSFLVGDRWRDIEAGRAAGCATVLIEQHYCERAPAAPPNASVRSLPEAVDWILDQVKKGA